MKQIPCILLIAGILSSGGCKEEAIHEAGELTGHWEVFAAEREGKETTLLNGAVFLFKEDGTMQTNITGEEHHGPFVLDKTTITYSGNEPMTFKIREFHGDTLVLITKLQEMQFRFDLHRTTTESQ